MLIIYLIYIRLKGFFDETCWTKLLSKKIGRCTTFLRLQVKITWFASCLLRWVRIKTHFPMKSPFFYSLFSSFTFFYFIYLWFLELRMSMSIMEVSAVCKEHTCNLRNWKLLSIWFTAIIVAKSVSFLKQQTTNCKQQTMTSWLLQII